MDARMDALASSDPTSLSEEAQGKLKVVKAALHAAFGQVVLAMSSVPRYRSHTLSDLSHLVIDPLAHDCVAIATPKSGGVTEAPAIAIWASVSEAADAKITEQVKAGAFPIRLKAEEWKSGEIVWLLDVIAPSRGMATAVLTNFHQIAKRGTLKIHPMIAHLVDKEVLAKLNSKPVSPSGDKVIN